MRAISSADESVVPPAAWPAKQVTARKAYSVVLESIDGLAVKEIFSTPQIYTLTYTLESIPSCVDKIHAAFRRLQPSSQMPSTEGPHPC